MKKSKKESGEKIVSMERKEMKEKDTSISLLEMFTKERESYLKCGVK